MNQRQWVIVQVALLHLQVYLDNVNGGGTSRAGWDKEDDGEPPTTAELDELVADLSKLVTN